MTVTVDTKICDAYSGRCVTPTPTPVCDAYSGRCTTVPPTTSVTTSPPPTGPLPRTGTTVPTGSLLLVALVLVLAGVGLIAMVRGRRA